MYANGRVGMSSGLEDILQPLGCVGTIVYSAVTVNVDWNLLLMV